MYNGTKTTLERAFELARSGEFATVTAIRLKLKSENYEYQKLEGRQLVAQLRNLIQESVREGGGPSDDAPPQSPD